jgi:hypothetical protein
MTGKKESPVHSGACKNRIYKNYRTYKKPRKQGVPFTEINSLALSVLPALLPRWLPDGKTYGQEYKARNPKRDDRKAGSFSVNLRTGRWADFATGDKGGDVISLAAYLFNIRQIEAKTRIAEMLGVKNHD